MSVLNLIRPQLINNGSYDYTQDGMRYRLHANELPWCPLNTSLNYYPADSEQKVLAMRLATYYQVDPKEIVLTRGSDDGIDLIMRLFLTAGQDAFMQFPPTFSMYAFYARLQQVEVIQCPLNSNTFSLSLEAINAQWRPSCKVLMFCSPNNPTANLMDLELIAATCEQYKNRAIIVVDEAYAEFSGQQSATKLIPQYENLIVLKTLSKAFGLAGLRIGSILAQPHIIDAFNQIIAPYNLAQPVIDIAMDALSNPEWFIEATGAICNAREWLTQELQKYPMIQSIYPSQANFILIKTNYAQELAHYCRELGIAIKSFPNDSQLADCLRLTVGDTSQNQLLMKAFSSFIDTVSGLNYAKNLIY